MENSRKVMTDCMEEVKKKGGVIITESAFYHSFAYSIPATTPNPLTQDAGLYAKIDLSALNTYAMEEFGSTATSSQKAGEGYTASQRPRDS